MITQKDVKLMLAWAADIDGRSWPDEAAFLRTVNAWRTVFTGGISVTEGGMSAPWLNGGIIAEAARRHYFTDARRITPADLIGQAQEIRRERLGRVRMPDLPPGAASDPALYAAAYAAAEEAILAEEDPDTPVAEVRARAAKAMDAAIAEARRGELGGPSS